MLLQMNSNSLVIKQKQKQTDMQVVVLDSWLSYNKTPL